MFESMVVTLREGVEAALIVAIVLGYLAKIGKRELSRSVYLGLGTAVALSIVAGILFKRLGVDEDKFEGWAMLAGSVFVATMVIWMWRTAKHLKSQIETKLDELTSSAKGRFSLGVFTFVFIMIFREGIETVLFLGAVQLTTTSLMNVVGGGTGLALAILFGVLFVKGSIRVNIRKFFSITSLILIVVAAQLLISGLHELSEALVLPSSAREMAIIGPIVKNQPFFYILILALSSIMIVLNRSTGSQQISPDANPAERRKLLHQETRERLWKRALAGVALVSILIISAEFVYSSNSGAAANPEQIFDQGQDIKIPISRVNDGKLHLFAYTAAGTSVRFILVSKGSSSIAAALDACQICGDKGYYQQGEEIICRNCTAPINRSSIGLAGGCNPVPLPTKADDQAVAIAASDLEAASSYFTRR